MKRQHNVLIISTMVILTVMVISSVNNQLNAIQHQRIAAQFATPAPIRSTGGGIPVVDMGSVRSGGGSGIPVIDMVALKQVMDAAAQQQALEAAAEQNSKASR